MIHNLAMKKFLLILSVLVCIFCGHSSVVHAASYHYAFEVVFDSEKKVPEFKSVAIKNLTKSETMVHDRHEFLGVRKLIDILGEVKDESRKVRFKTNYMRISDNDVVSVVDKATWYYFINKKSKKPIYALYYPTNDVTEIMTEGDLLVIGKVSDTEIYVILLAKDSDKRAEFLKRFDGGLAATGSKKKVDDDKPSFWSRLWNKSYEVEETQPVETPVELQEIKAKDWIRIYFTPGPDCENNIVAEINKAKKIDIAVYSINNRKIVDAILAAKKRGAKVRVITDRLMSSNKYSLDEELAAAGIPVVIHKKHKIMHNKYAIFDGKTIVTGSYNWTKAATQSNSENCLFFEQPDKEYSVHFEELWDLYSD